MPKHLSTTRTSSNSGVRTMSSSAARRLSQSSSLPVPTRGVFRFQNPRFLPQKNAKPFSPSPLCGRPPIFGARIYFITRRSSGAADGSVRPPSPGARARGGTAHVVGEMAASVAGARVAGCWCVPACCCFRSFPYHFRVASSVLRCCCCCWWTGAW